MQPARRRLTLIATLALAATAVTVTSAQAQTIPWATQIAASPDAQTLPEDRGADGLWQTLRKLHTRASVMMIVAHPDDEDGGMLTLESRGAGARVAMLTLTRGEGGQNAMSSETYDALGLIRTNELLRADEFSGTEQYWTRVADYGFSKTIDEAFQQWGHDRVLYDVVRAVRLNRPLVITSVFSGNVTDGHGHHQVSGEMAQEVFKAAGDPNVFPDQIAAGLRPWSPLKVYARVPGFSINGKTMFDYATGKSSPLHLRDYVNNQWMDNVPATNVEIPEGTFDPVLGRSYLQMAREGWSEQKSQNGGGNPPLPGPFNVSYHRYGSLVETTDQESSFFDGIDVSLAGIASLAHGDTQFLKDGLREIDRYVSRALYAYVPSDPAKIVPDLHDGYLKTRQLIDAVNASALSADDKANVDHELQIKLAQFNTALAEALGLQVNALVTPRLESDRNPFSGSSADMTFLHATPGMRFNVRLHVTSAEPWTAGGKLRLARTWLVTPDDEHWPVERAGGPVAPSAADADVLFKIEVPNRAAPTRPYFSRPSIEQPYYNILDADNKATRWLNRSFAPYPVEGWAEFNYDGVPIRVGQVVQTVHWVHGPGGVYQPLVVLPQISVSIGSGAGVVPLGSKSFPLTVTLDNEQQDATDGELHLQLPDGWTAEPATAKFHLPANDPDTVTFTVHPSSLTDASYTIKAVARSGNYEFSEGVQTVGYPGVRPYYYYHPATYRAHGVDVKVASSLNVGYIMGTGDDVPQALEQIGVHPHLLTADEVLHGDLSRYNAIVLGIRTYAARPELAAANGRLLDYAQHGGTVIVQYNSGEYDHNFGPYPYTLGRSPEKVVDEKSKVTILEPDNPLLTWPNHITDADFNGWIEERGHSFMQSWDPRYTALTETHDPGQDPQKGGLLYAHYGKGAYIYVSYALYRQMTDGVPGAYRIFANLVSAGADRTGGRASLQ